MIAESGFLHAEMMSLAEQIVDTTWEANTTMFQEGDTLERALYLVYSGKIQLTKRSTDITTQQPLVLDAGGFFGHELLTGDMRYVQPDGSAPDDILDRPSTAQIGYSAVVMEHAVIGILTLKNCRKVVDTTKLGQFCGRRVNNNNFQSVLDTEIKLKSLKKHCILGSGSFGQVILVSRESKTYNIKNWFALKVQSKYKVFKGDTNVERILAEKDLLLPLRHPFIMSLRTTYQDEDFLYMLTDFLPGGELLNRIDQNGLPEKDVAFYAACLFEAIQYLHSRCIMHRDLKPANVVLDHEGYPVLIDFGFGTCCHILYPKTTTTTNQK